jgi:hypothetical protein
VTVEIPIVCVTDAAGLGVRGVVITPCENSADDTSVIDNTEANRNIDSFGISCVFKVRNDTIYILQKTQINFYLQTVTLHVERWAINKGKL